ncbi:unnamed protein product, partial [Meganyctiphanes norvegica]
TKADDKGDSGLDGRILYLCRGGDCAYFSVDVDDGSIKLKEKLDAESQAEHKFTVVANDMGLPKRFASLTINIQVKDINDQNQCGIMRCTIAKYHPGGTAEAHHYSSQS